MKASGVKPNWVGDTEWALWQTYWGDDKVQKLAKANSEHKLTVPTDGSGISIHYCGSQALVVTQHRAVSIDVLFSYFSDLIFSVYKFSY